MTEEYFAVELSNSIYLGVPLVDLVSIVQFELRDICLVPGVAPCWYGVVNFKGSLLWVLDSDRWFELDTTKNLQKNKLTAVIISDRGVLTHRRVALAVRRLQGIFTVEPEGVKTLSDSESTLFLQKFSTGAVVREANNLYLLDSQFLLQQLNQHTYLST